MKKKFINKISTLIPIFIFFAYLNNYFYNIFLYSRFNIPTQFIEFNLLSIFHSNASISILIFIVFFIIYSVIVFVRDMFKYNRVDLLFILFLALVLKYLFNYTEPIINALIYVVLFTIVLDIITKIINRNKKKTNSALNDDDDDGSILPVIFVLIIFYISIMSFTCDKLINLEKYTMFEHNDKIYLNVRIFNNLLISKEYLSDENKLSETFELIDINSPIKYWSSSLDSIIVIPNAIREDLQE